MCPLPLFPKCKWCRNFQSVFSTHGAEWVAWACGSSMSHVKGYRYARYTPLLAKIASRQVLQTPSKSTHLQQTETHNHTHTQHTPVSTCTSKSKTKSAFHTCICGHQCYGRTHTKSRQTHTHTFTHTHSQARLPCTVTRVQEGLYPYRGP